MCIAFWYTATSPCANHEDDGSNGVSNDNGNRKPSPNVPKSPYAFILLSNRDLELGRPASDATFHDFEPIPIQPYGASKADVLSSSSPSPKTTPHQVSTGSNHLETSGRQILSGRDAADSVGGTWLGLGMYQQPCPNLTRSGRIGVLTNIHDDSPIPKGTKSRGALLRDWLRGLPAAGGGAEETVGDVDPDVASKRYLEGLKDDAVKLAGFNLLLFDILMKDDPSTTTASAAGSRKTVDRVTAVQLTNRYRPTKSAQHGESTTIPADQRSISTGTQTRILPVPPDAACTQESPLGVFQAAITELKPAALRMGGMSNSLLEEPFPKVLNGLRELQRVLEEQLRCGTEWEEEQERQLLERLFQLMSESHPIHTFQDLELSICVPLCTIPLPISSLYHSDRPPARSAAECNEDEDEDAMHDGGPRKTKNPGLHINVRPAAASPAGAVNPHTMLSTPLVTPEPSPVKPSFKALPSGVAELGSVPEDAIDASGDVGQQGETSMVCTGAASDSTRGDATATQTKHYGTRLTTIILVKWNGEVTYVERDVWWQDKRGAVHKGGTRDRVFHLRL